LDSELAQRSVDLRWLAPTRQLLLNRPMLVVASQRSVHVHVGAHRNAFSHHDLAQHVQVANRAFLIYEVSATKHFARSVIDRAHQAHLRAAPFEPVVAAAIPQDQLTCAQPPIPSSSVLGCSPLTRTSNAGRPQHPLNRRA